MAKKTAEPVEATVVEPVQPVRHDHSKKRRHMGSIFWGFAFIFVGMLFLLDNLQVITVHFDNLWQLWPILIIGAGVSTLSLRGWIGALVSLILVVAFAALAYLVAVDNPWFDSSGHLQCSLHGESSCFHEFFRRSSP